MNGQIPRKVFTFNNGRYEWIAEGDPSDPYSMFSQYNLHEFMERRYQERKRSKANCINCGAPYCGGERCEYCGTHYDKEG